MSSLSFGVRVLLRSPEKPVNNASSFQVFSFVVKDAQTEDTQTNFEANFCGY